MPILESVLPVRLRADGLTKSGPDLAGNTPSPRELARVLSRAQRVHHVDLLSYLGVNQGRWKAVVWIVTGIVDDLWRSHGPSPSPSPSHTTHLTGPWQGMRSLDDVTAEAVSLEALSESAPTAPARLRSPETMDDLTMNNHPLHRPLDARIKHVALGNVWRSLGNMIVADAARASKADERDRNITPEILEIIALLHHRGIMPASIYSYQPSTDTTALQQPPTLHLLSSHILTSLTDAAWRAHETLVVEEAKSKGGQYSSLRPELPGSMYKVRVAGLGHEVWLELVLWSCLHGGWTLEGASILENINKKELKGQWSLLSWRELVQPVIRAGQENKINWDELRYLLNSGSVYGDPTSAQASKKRVKRTVSTEIVAAFVDALINDIGTSVGGRGVSPGQILVFIQSLKALLARNNFSLGSTSWDAVVLRFIESQGIDVHKEPGVAEKMIQLSSEFGQETNAVNAPMRTESWQPLPVYVLDGTAAPLGFMHRILRSYINVGNLGGALRVFTALQQMTDRNKQMAIKNFFHRNKALDRKPVSDEVDFESRYAGIEYPGFFPQIPATVLAPLLDLITEARAFGFGTWLLQSEDVDGPIIPDSVFGDPIVGPSLIRFASALGDKAMLIKILERQTGTNEAATRLPERTLLAFLDNQILTKNWNSVQMMLDIVNKNPEYSLHEATIASLIRAVLRELKPADKLTFDSSQKPDAANALRTLSNLVKAQAGRSKHSEFYAQIKTMLFVLASIDEKWANFCCKLQPLTRGQRYNLNIKSFDTILEGVVGAYGSEKGKLFLSRFWSAASDPVRVVNNVGGIHDDRAHRTRVPNDMPGRYSQRSGLDRFAFGVQGKLLDEIQRSHPNAGRLAGEFRPTTSTLRIILRKALEENHASDQKQLQQDLEWAARRMKLLGLRNRDVREELERVAGQSDKTRHILDELLEQR
ncbi:hypothetical protein MBLNU459_g6022t1 [Dothideomycetes sp. NU459]